MIMIGLEPLALMQARTAAAAQELLVLRLQRQSVLRLGFAVTWRS
jgi:hypothetical protein